MPGANQSLLTASLKFLVDFFDPRIILCQSDMPRLFKIFKIFYLSWINLLFFVYRRKVRLKHYQSLHRFQLPVAELDCRLSSNCDQSPVNNLCRRCIDNYSKFYSSTSVSEFFKPFAPVPKATLMAIKISDYKDYGDYISDIRRSSFFLRKSNKSIKSGHYFQEFQYENFMPDILKIRHSSEPRASSLPEDPYLLTEEVLHKPPVTFKSIQQPLCHLHFEKWFGIFIKDTGRRQGEVVVNQKLIAYTRLRRIGNSIKYHELIGDVEHLGSGCMALLHLEVMKMLFLKTDFYFTGVGYLTYNTLERGAEGLFFWKRKALFSPFKIQYVQ